MRKNYIIIIFILLTLFITGSFSDAFAQLGNQYCQVPAVATSVAEPNVLFVIDASGSMSWKAYEYGTPLPTYNATKSYEGYFDPNKSYTLVSGVYKEHIPTGTPCTCTCSNWRCRNSDWGGCVWKGGGCGRWGCCLAQTCTGDCNVDSGNYLNFHLMRRIDLLRWAVTGGTPSSCTGSHTFDTGYCDPELYNDVSGAGKVNTVCSDTLAIDDLGTVLGGCILLADDGNRVAVPWSRINSSVVGTLKALSLKPRLGAMSYQGSGVLANKVYVGDFLAPNTTNTTYPYMNLITHINSISPNSSTPTGPAMWDALNYFAQNSPQYGGFSPQSGGGDRWKNPMYICDGGGLNCKIMQCANNFVILLSDGQWNTPSCSIDDTPQPDPVVPAYQMHKGFTNSPTTEPTKVTSVYTVGLFLGGTGELALKNVAMYGSFDNASKTWPDSLTGYPGGSCTMTDCGAGKGSACTALPASSVDWDTNTDNLPDTFFSATDAHEIKDRLVSVMESILSHSLSGSSASVLASGEGSGSNILQAVYYPKRSFGDVSIGWTGYLQNLWLFRSKFLTDEDGNMLTSIREDTDENKILDIGNDYIASYYFDTAEQKVKIARCQDVNKNGGCKTPPDIMQPTVDPENLKSLWEAGKLLWSRDLSTDSRTIYTQIDGSNLIDFSTAAANVTALMPYLDLPAIGDVNLDGWIDGDINHSGAVDSTDATYLIKYVHGEDIDLDGDTLPDPLYRSRTVKIGTETHVWKLGDIINSTPKILSWVPLNGYHIAYKDYTYGPICEDCEVSLSEPANPYYFTTRDTQTNVVDGVTISPGTIDGYRKRGMVFVGGNDGMLHAFKLGTLQLRWTGKTKDQYGRLTGTDLGKEMWAFIPKNVLPYLKYMMDPQYCHIYNVDLTPLVFDASINNDHSAAAASGCTDTDYWNCTKTADSWRTILIGGMKLGGACRNKDSTTACTDCVKTPASMDNNGDSDTSDPGDGLGYSSYFALDVTDQNNPRLLWEFTHPELGFATTGPAVVKIGARNASGIVDVTKNGKWVVIFGSGPTGPISGGMQFLGRSDQNLKLFIFDVKNGPGANNANVVIKDTGINNAFASSMFNSEHDFSPSPEDYQDDAVYLGYTKKCTSTNNICTAGEWNDGGVLRLFTKKTLTDNTPLDPNTWAVSKVIDGVGPVTGGIKRLRKIREGIVWLYFATGRWFYNQGTNLDDPDKVRSLFALKEPCYSGGTLDVNCTTQRFFCTTPCSNPPLCTNPTNCVDLRNVTDQLSATTDPDNTSYKGWYKNMDVSGSYTYSGVIRDFKAERSTTQPGVSTLGCVYFTSYKPYEGGCVSGGKSFDWSLDFEKGIDRYCPAVRIVQLSTGEINLDPPGPGKSDAKEGVSESNADTIKPPKPVKRALHMKER